MLGRSKWEEWEWRSSFEDLANGSLGTDVEKFSLNHLLFFTHIYYGLDHE